MGENVGTDESGRTMPPEKRADLRDYYAQNGHTAIRVGYALGGAYVGITEDVRAIAGGRVGIRVTPDQAREIARSLIACADASTGKGGH